jgi:PAS domain-containing protein
LYPVDGGLITGLKANTPVADVSFMTFSGIDQIREILETMQPEKIKGMLFLELMACKGGCINGPGVASHDSMAVKRHRIIKGIEKSNIKPPQDEENNIQIEKKYEPCQVKDQNVFSENEIKSALESIGKIAKTDELNCSGCGYETCRNFAIAMLKGKAERTMCVSYMRKVAQDKASVLLQKMPYGVVMVDEQMKVIECNSHFARMAGKETAMVFENKPGLSGASLVKLIPYHGYFANLIDSGAEGLEKDIKDNGRLLHLSLFTIQKHKMVCGIIHNLKVPEIQREEMVKRTQQVIEDNLATVQKVAFLLSENASRTEVTLNSLSDFNNGDQNE